MKTLRRLDDKERKKMFAELFGLDFDPTKEYSEGEQLIQALNAAKILVSNLPTEDHSETE